MILKNDDILLIYDTLQRLIDNKEFKSNISIGYIMIKNKITLEPLVNAIYDMRRDIALEYSIGEEENGNVKIPKEKAEEVTQKLKELMNIENEVNLIQISIDSLKNAELTLEDTMGLMYMLKPFELEDLTDNIDDIDEVET